jgi:hypothetical protein
MHDYKSLQLDDEDSSKYFINYISEDSDDTGDSNNNETELIHSPDDNNGIDVSSLPSSLIITPVPQELFINQQLKVNICLSISLYFFIFQIYKGRI